MSEEQETESESTNSDFNFGDMTISDKEDEPEETKNNEMEALKCEHNLNVTESMWYLKEDDDGKEGESERKLHRNDKELKVRRFKCELFYAQRRYQEALQLIQDIFIDFDVDPYTQFGNELIDILIRCLCKCQHFDQALKYIDKLLMRDVSFGTIQIISKIYGCTGQYDKAFSFALDLTKKETLNVMCWYQLIICARNIKDYDFCYVCSRLLAEIIAIQIQHNLQMNYLKGLSLFL